MSRSTRILFSLLLIGVILAGGMALAKPGGGKGGGKFIACPFPPCMAPCAFPPEPEVVCKSKGQGTFITSYFCCCCGSAGNKYRPL